MVYRQYECQATQYQQKAIEEKYQILRRKNQGKAP